LSRAAFAVKILLNPFTFDGEEYLFPRTEDIDAELGEVTFGQREEGLEVNLRAQKEPSFRWKVISWRGYVAIKSREHTSATSKTN